MLFNSLDFIGFLIVVLPLYFILPHKFRWVLLLLASYIFYMSWNYTYIVLILFTTTINYLMGIFMGRAKTKHWKRVWLLVGLISSLAVLFGFKYLNFMIDITNGVLQIVHADLVISNMNILLPVGISFFTLQTLSYTIDVYRGEKSVEKHFGIFALYVSFFPQLVAGPIERSEHLLPQFHIKHRFDPDRFRRGLYKVLGGYFMKMIVADRLAISVNKVYSVPEEFAGFSLIIATIAFGLQIYCDFAGYSLIAIGTAEIMGIKLMQNFRSPYLAINIKQFWDRWHISLTTWFRDYIYIPLGGNRKGVARQYLNILLVFAISGLWHGASFAFILWGVIHALLQIIERSTRPLTDPLKNNRFAGVRIGFNTLSYLSTFICVMLAWVFFRAGTMDNAIAVFSNMFQFSGNEFSLNAAFPRLDIQDQYVAIIAVILLGIAEIINQKHNLINWLESKPLVLRQSVIIIMIMLIILFGIYGENTVNQFIYFQF